MEMRTPFTRRAGDIGRKAKRDVVMKVVNRLEINTKPEKVFYWLEAPDRAMKWMTSVTRTEIIKETPDRVGTTCREYVEENGRGTEMRGVFTEFVSNERFAVQLEGDFNAVDVNFILNEKGDMTELTQNVELRFKGLLKILCLFLGSSIKKKILSQTESEFARLNAL